MREWSFLVNLSIFWFATYTEAKNVQAIIHCKRNSIVIMSSSWGARRTYVMKNMHGFYGFLRLLVLSVQAFYRYYGLHQERNLLQLRKLDAKKIIYRLGYCESILPDTALQHHWESSIATSPDLSQTHTEIFIQSCAESQIWCRYYFAFSWIICNMWLDWDWSPCSQITTKIMLNELINNYIASTTQVPNKTPVSKNISLFNRD